MNKQPSKMQRGYVLLITLVMLIVLTLLALTEAVLNTTQTRVAANATDSEVSFEKTEAALNEAIDYLFNGTYASANFLQNNNGLYIFNVNASPLWTTINWSGPAVINSFAGGTGSQASYIIEQLPSVIQPGQNMQTPTNIYRITARSVGANGNSSILIQTTVQIQQ
ncbi:MAG: pilus assembly protein PilX [Legionellales bacterium]